VTEEPSVIDVGNLQLSAWKTAAEVEESTLAARSAYNSVMMDCIAKRVQIEKDISILRAMEMALVSYRRSMSELEKERRRLQRRAVATVDAVTHAQWLYSGQHINPNNVKFVWIGLRYLITQAMLTEYSSEVSNAMSVNVPKKALKSGNFARPRDLSDTCEDAPEECTHIRNLMEWLADQSYMPRIGSSAMSVLGSVMCVLSGCMQKKLVVAEGRLKAANDELMTLRQQSWKTVNISTPPKTAS